MYRLLNYLIGLWIGIYLYCKWLYVGFLLVKVLLIRIKFNEYINFILNFFFVVIS